MQTPNCKNIYIYFFIILCNLWRVWKKFEASQSVHAHSLARKEKRLLEISCISSYGVLKEKKDSCKILICDPWQHSFVILNLKLE